MFKGKLILILMAFLLATPWMPAQAAEERKLVYATYLTPTQGALIEIDAWFMDEVTKRTNGQITFERYYGGTLLKAADVIPGVGSGAADIGSGAPGGYNRGDFPLSNISLPFISSHVDSVISAFGELYKSNEQLRREYERQGLKLLYAPAYAENVLWSTRPVRKPEDVNGLKVRALLAVGDGLSKLGAATVAIPWQDAVEGMQRGVLDAMAAAPADTGVRAGLHKIAKHATDVGGMGVYALAATVINQKTWESLDSETQRIFEEVAAEVPAYYIKALNNDIDKAVAVLKAAVANGEFEVSGFSEEDAAKLQEEIGKPLWAEWVKWANESGADGQAMLDEFISLIRKHEVNSQYVPVFSRLKQ